MYILITIAYAHTSAVLVTFYYNYLLRKKQSHRHSLCCEMSHVSFAYRIMLNILNKVLESYKNPTKNIILRF